MHLDRTTFGGHRRRRAQGFAASHERFKNPKLQVTTPARVVAFQWACGGQAPFVPHAPCTSRTLALSINALNSAALPKCHAILAGSSDRIPSWRCSSSCLRISMPPVFTSLAPHTPWPSIGSDYVPSREAKACFRKRRAETGTPNEPGRLNKLSCPDRMDRHALPDCSCQNPDARPTVRKRRGAQSVAVRCCRRQVLIPINRNTLEAR